jgi:hypothetical protein
MVSRGGRGRTHTSVTWVAGAERSRLGSSRGWTRVRACGGSMLVAGRAPSRVRFWRRATRRRSWGSTRRRRSSSVRGRASINGRGCARERRGSPGRGWSGGHGRPGAVLNFVRTRPPALRWSGDAPAERGMLRGTTSERCRCCATWDALLAVSPDTSELTRSALRVCPGAADDHCAAGPKPSRSNRSTSRRGSVTSTTTGRRSGRQGGRTAHRCRSSQTG